MLTRSLLITAIASTLFACSEAPASGGTVPGATSKETPTTGTGDKTTTATNSTAAGTTSVLDGTWDITVDGLAASSLTVAGDKITGTLVSNDEGTSPDGVCTVSQHRTTVALTLSGDAMTGTFTNNFVLTGDPDQCVGDTGTSTFSATRTHAAANANGKTPVEGVWTVTPDTSDSSATPFAVTVAGLAATLWETTAQTNKDMDVAVTTTTVTGNYAGDNTPGVAFAARKR